MRESCTIDFRRSSGGVCAVKDLPALATSKVFKESATSVLGSSG